MVGDTQARQVDRIAQSKLIQHLGYVARALADLGCRSGAGCPGEDVPVVPHGGGATRRRQHDSVDAVLEQGVPAVDSGFHMPATVVAMASSTSRIR